MMKAHALNAGWEVVGEQQLPGAMVYRMERDTLNARLSVRTSGSVNISVEENSPSAGLRIAYAGGVIAVVAVAVIAAWGLQRTGSADEGGG